MSLPVGTACDVLSPPGVLCVFQGDSRKKRGRDHPESYLAMSQAYHRALAGTFREIVASLPLRPGDRVIDVACGDGAWSCWLAERVGNGGTVAAIDIAGASLELTRRATSEGQAGRPVRLYRASADRLPFPNHSFDLAWCAQSLYSLPDAAEALREMVRVVRPGGAVAVLENDSLHDILLPWPVDLELEVRTAEWRALAATTGTPARYYVGRWLAALLGEMGLQRPVVKVWATTRQVPLTEDERAYLAAHLNRLRRQARPYLTPESRGKIDRLLVPGAVTSLLDRSDLTVTFLNRLAWAAKPE